jgi:hypothetical protein
MNAEHFSAEAFEQASQTVFKDALARRLRNEVEAELANVVSRVMQGLVNDLNGAGHKLVPHGTQTATDSTSETNAAQTAIACFLRAIS